MVSRLWRKFGFASRPVVIDAANRSEHLTRDTNDLSGVFVMQLPERGTRLPRRDARASRQYSTEEQRSPGGIGSLEGALYIIRASH